MSQCTPIHRTKKHTHPMREGSIQHPCSFANSVSNVALFRTGRLPCPMPQHSPRAVIPPTIIIASCCMVLYSDTVSLPISHGVLTCRRSTVLELHDCICHSPGQMSKLWCTIFFFYFCLHPTRPPSPFILSCFRDLFLTVDPPPTNQIGWAAPCRHTRRLRTATRCPSPPPLPPFHPPDMHTYAHKRALHRTTLEHEDLFLPIV